MIVRIRHAEERDRDAARTVQAAVLAGSHPYQYSRNIGLPETLNLVAEVGGRLQCFDGTVVGFLSALLSRRNPQGEQLWERAAPYLGFIGVMPAHQKRWVGTLLVQRAIEEIRSRCRDARFFYLEHDGSSELNRFYLRLGFRSVLPEEALFRAWALSEGRFDVI